MRTPKTLALLGGAALLVAVAYGAHSSSESESTRKASARSAKEQLLLIKKEEAKNRATVRTGATASGARGQAAQRGRNREVEPNDRARQASSLLGGLQQNLGASCPGTSSNDIQLCAQSVEVFGTIDPPGDKDFYSVNLLAGDILQVSLDSDKLGAPTDLIVRVHGPVDPNLPDSCGALLSERDDGNGFSGVTTDACAFTKVDVAGKYLIEVEDLWFGGGPDRTYRLTASVPMFQEQEPNNAPLAGNPLEIQLVDCVGAVSGCGTGVSSSGGASAGIRQFPASMQLVEGVGATRLASSSSDQGGLAFPSSTCIAGVIDPAGDVDCYDFPLLTGQVAQVGIDGFKCGSSLCDTKLDPELTLYDPAGVIVATDDDTDDLDSGILYTAQTAGVHSVCVTDHFSDGLPCYIYRLNVDIAGCSGETESNDVCATADEILCHVEDTCSQGIQSLSLRDRSSGTIMTFMRDASWVAPVTFNVNGVSGTFNVSGAQCLKVGDRSGKLEIVAIHDPSGLNQAKCAN